MNSDIFSQLKNKEFVKIVHREIIPLINSLVHRGVSSQENFIEAVGYKFCYRYKIEIEGSVYYLDEELDKEDKILKNLIEKESSFLDRYLDRLKNLIEKILKEIKIVRFKDEFKEFSRRIGLIHPVVPYLVGFLKIERIIAEKIRAILKSKGVPEEKIDSYLLPISKPFKKDLHSESELALLELAQAYLKNKKNLEKINDKIEKFLAKYGFADMRWGTGRALSRKRLLEKIKQIKNPGAKLKRLHQQEAQNKKELKEIISSLDLNKSQLKLVESAQKYAYFRTYRGDIFDIWLYKSLPLLSKIARRLGLFEDDIKFLTFQEILTKKVPSKEEIKRRKNYKFVAIRSPKGFILTTNRRIINKLNKILSELSEVSVSTIKGLSAHRGKVSGVVKIVKSVRDINKVKKGDILVSPMTTPNFAPAIKKARAIITDEGGITCHAAIISRELGKPCIIGTKIATRVLKDEMVVEVDANRGIVRIIKK